VQRTFVRARVAFEAHRSVRQRGERRQEPHHGARVAHVDGGRAVQPGRDDAPELAAAVRVDALLDVYAERAQGLGHQQRVP
jgi:hypothetical protein